jgi:hypothetical protein
MTRLAWLTAPAVEATAAAVKTAIEKLKFLRAMDAHVLDLSMLAAERRRFLATVGRRSTNQALERWEDERKYPILLTLVAQSAHRQGAPVLRGPGRGQWERVEIDTLHEIGSDYRRSPHLSGGSMPLRRTLLAVSACMLIVALAPSTAAMAHPVPPATPAVGSKTCAQARPVSTDADGDNHHVFAFPNGATTDEITAAPGLDPDTATPARLKKLGLPDRPARGTSDRPAWDNLIRGRMAKQNAQAPCVLNRVTAASLPPVSHHWYAGYEAHAAAGKNFSGAHASYTAPSYYLSTCSDESMTQWVGVQNSAGTVLAQAGLYTTQYGTMHGGGFFEFVNGPWNTLGLVDLNVIYYAGDRYYFNISYADATDWAIDVEDLDDSANSWIGFYHVDGGGGTGYIAPTAYAISERLTYGSTLTQYMNHSTVSFRTTQAIIDGAGAARFSIENPQRYDMYSKDGKTELSNVGALDTSTSNFAENWKACGKVEHN